METLFISAKEIVELVSMRELIDAIEEVMILKGRGEVVMPEKTYVELPRGDFRVMPCFIEKYGMACTKVVSVCPDNRTLNLPTVQAILVLLDGTTGSPIAVMDGTTITSLRTGAAGAVAVKYLTDVKKRVKIGMVGAGTQARSQFSAIREVVKEVEEVRVMDINPTVAKRFAEELSSLGFRSVVVDSAREAVDGVDIIVTTTTARGPVVIDEWVRDGVHINAIGADAPGKQELDPRILKRAKIFVDDLTQASQSGEINVPLSQGILSLRDVSGELSDVMVGRISGRSSNKDVTVFDSTGLAIWDLAMARMVYNRARECGAGRSVSLY
ncbi:MAG: ornithine cyclodeaminase family protein [Aigarchaeota archaeon]|nr:ornithine cyclodeaminase family protein [Aigarchaeota archaeon]MDW8092517.1 ornithine cyclodeaminase family protein [Nitrososphaerota archaeon]